MSKVLETDLPVTVVVDLIPNRATTPVSWQHQTCHGLKIASSSLSEVRSERFCPDIESPANAQGTFRVLLLSTLSVSSSELNSVMERLNMSRLYHSASTVWIQSSCVMVATLFLNTLTYI